MSEEEFPVPDRVILSASVGLDRYSYEALERAIVDILEDGTHTIAVRLLAAHTLLDAAIAEYGRGSKTTSAFAVWMKHMNAPSQRTWLYQAATARRNGSPWRQRAVMAPLISSMEMRFAATAHRGQVLPRRPGASLVAMSQGKGRLFLPSLEVDVELESLCRVAFEQDAPEMRSPLVRYLAESVRHRTLLKYPSVLRGVKYLLVSFDLVRWYAMASAASRGQEVAVEEDLRRAIQAVERCYDREDALPRALARRRSLAFKMALLIDLMSSPVDLVVSPAYD